MKRSDDRGGSARRSGDDKGDDSIFHGSDNSPSRHANSSLSSFYSSGHTTARKRLGLLPTLLWLSLAGAVLREKSNLVGNAVVLAEETSSSSRGGGSGSIHTSRRRPPSDGDLIIVEDGVAVKLINHDDLVDEDGANGDNSINDGEGDGVDGVIVTVSVDGTLAGISKRTGRVLWKKQSKDTVITATSPLSPSSGPRASATTSGKLDQDADRFLMQPLVSTTTTTKSASTSHYAAVPSVDGTVFTTSNDMTISSSVKELVARAPYLDAKGRFYVGSRHATAAALDGETGEVLRVIVPDGRSKGRSKSDNDDNETLPDLEGRNVVWIGRVDYLVSVQDARTGIMEAQFSVAEVMSVADMHGTTEKEAWKPERFQSKSLSSDVASKSSSSGAGVTNQAEQNIVNRLGLPASGDPFQIFPASDVATASNDPKDVNIVSSTLVGTPNGNIGFWDSTYDRLSWVAHETFDTPVVFAMDATTGLPVEVELIPDVPDPNADVDYITREMERQLEISAQEEDQPDEQTIVGAMANGQLYALPLGRKTARASLSGRTITGATSHKKPGHTVSHFPGRKTSASLTSDLHQHHRNEHESHGQQHQGVESHPLSAKKACVSSSPSFPGCLVKDRPESHPHHTGGNYKFLPKPRSEMVPPLGRGEHLQYLPGRFDGHDKGSLSVMTSHFHKEDGGFYHPEFGYVSPDDIFRAQQRKNQQKFYRRFLKVLGSWLPPTIALLFVVSFELGRRKRLNDQKTSQPQDAQQQKVLFSTDCSDEQLERQSILSAVSSTKDIQLVQQQHVIKVSDEVLGYGGHGTVVYKGVLDGREVAVKRMLKAYHASADREISLLIESDGDPNVVRYFLKELRGDFVYLALELCDLSLHDLIGVLREHAQIVPQLVPTDATQLSNHTQTMESKQRILRQIASGVSHLHALRIIHRDLKPANILLAIPKHGKKKSNSDDPIFDTFIHDYYEAKISDMGLGKQLRGQSSLGASLVGESSFRGSTGGRATSIGIGPGSVGWQAPEVMALRQTSDMSTRSIDSASNACDGNKDATVSGEAQANPRTSRSVDIFSLGCIFYSVLIPGSHPFGEWFEREANIMHNKPNLTPLKSISIEAYCLIYSMLDRNPKLRPTAKEVCQHPFFWSSHKKLIFLCDVSDRIETECTSQSSANDISLAIERGAIDVVGSSWEARLDQALVDNVQKFRTYDYACIRDLLRLIRNKHHHFDELPEAFRQSTVPNQDSMLDYFQAKFPSLVMHCYNFSRISLADESLLSKYKIASLSKVEVKVTLTAPVAVVVSNTKGQAAEPKLIEDTVSNPPAVALERNNHQVDDVASQDNESTASTDNDELGSDDKDIPNFEDDEVQRESSRTIVSSPDQEDIIVWEGSAAARAFNCRGWCRSHDEWSRHIEPCYKKRDPALKRCTEDPKFRTRLCNHWDNSLGIECPMKKKGKCVFAHGPAELRVKEGKKNRWGRLVDKNGNNANPWHSGGEDTYGAATSIEKVRKEEGKWNTSSSLGKNNNGSSTPTAKKQRPTTSNRSDASKYNRNDNSSTTNVDADSKAMADVVPEGCTKETGNANAEVGASIPMVGDKEVNEGPEKE